MLFEFHSIVKMFNSHLPIFACGLSMNIGLSDSFMDYYLPVLRCNASKWSNYTACCIVSGSIRNMRHQITAINCRMCVIVSNVNFGFVYQIRCPFATLKFLLINILIVLLGIAIHVQEKIFDKKNRNAFHFQNFLFVGHKSIKIWSIILLTAGMTSAGLRRFFVRRQNRINTTKIRMIITNDIDATIILNTGLVSKGEDLEKFKMYSFTSSIILC